MIEWAHGPVRARWTTTAEGSLGHWPPRADHNDACCGAEAQARRAAVHEGPWLFLTQFHGSGVVTARSVSDVASLAGSPADAAVTDAAGAPLVVATADCAPIVLAADNGVAAAVHAGWKGLAAGVLEATVAQMRHLGAESIAGALGPCIHRECYAFGNEALDEFAERWGPAVRATTADGEPAFDLPAAVGAEAARLDIRLDRSPSVCTACSPNFFSYRARKDTGRQVLVVWREE